MDQESFAGRITDEMDELDSPQRSFLADVTSNNPNVMYELGLAHAQGKRRCTILIADSVERIPFDIKDYVVILYGF